MTRSATAWSAHVSRQLRWTKRPCCISFTRVRSTLRCSPANTSKIAGCFDRYRDMDDARLLRLAEVQSQVFGYAEKISPFQ